ncbi:dimethyladenosine transferase 2, mitochondrial isoform X1 [Marmota flaviventris]|uniref:dimethyladenosine transferase 2, mitochondrial isoform X1 n=1 Tax=Marmota flaviventris TaxID=93162 RepID=UPI000FFF6D37|nr:dimethyladenosine transferase 2, mitochondrial [Marmota flaviventris]
MWGPSTGLAPRLTWSVLAAAGRFSTLRSGTTKRKDLPARNRRGLSDFSPQPLPYTDLEESPWWMSKCRSEPGRYITSRKLAETLIKLVRTKRKNPEQLFLECNPGPGILTRALLEAGAKVVALESDKTFIPHLESLGENMDRRLKVVYCDFFKMDPDNCTIAKPPVYVSNELFKDLGIRAVSWKAGIPLKIVGILPFRSERNILWKLLYDLYSCTSIYKYGRVELNMFVSEKEYQNLTAGPKNPNFYQALSVLWQVACDVKLLHVEPWSSFDIYPQNGQLEKLKHREPLEPIQQNLYFIQMTPRKTLFTEQLTPVNYDVFFHMVKHCFGKRNAKLVDHLHSLSPVDAKHILRQIRKNENVKTINMYPRNFKQLFQTIQCSEDYAHKWLCNENLEDSAM